MLTDLRQWNEDRFGFSAARLRNCLIYVLDHCDWWTSEITEASMKNQKFITKLNEVTPPGWEPNAPQPVKKRKLYLRGDPACRKCGGSGKVEDYDANIIGARPSLPCPDCQRSWQLPLGGGKWMAVLRKTSTSTRSSSDAGARSPDRRPRSSPVRLRTTTKTGKIAPSPFSAFRAPRRGRATEGRKPLLKCVCGVY